MKDALPIIITVGLSILSILAGFLVWLLCQWRERWGIESRNTQRLAKEITQTFLEADASFKSLIDTLRDLENLAEIRKRVDAILQSLVDAHEKLRSQLDGNGRTVGQLHALVARWSEEGSQLQQSYERLALVLEEALAIQNQRSEKLSGDLDRLLSTYARAAS